MKLADLQLAIELQAALDRLDSIPAGCALLEANGLDLELTADELASFVEWRRQNLHRQLRQLGVEPDGNQEYPEERSGTAREAPSTRGDLVADDAIPKGTQSAAPNQMPRPANRAEALRIATDELMGDYRDLLTRKLIDQHHYDTILGQREPRIRERADTLMAEPMPVEPCARCGVPSTTVIDGTPLCDADAQKRPRLVRPAFLGASP